jgi:hypothetical protein
MSPNAASLRLRPALLAAIAGLALPAAAQAQFLWTQQTVSPEWNTTRTAQVGPNLICFNNWNFGQAVVPACPPFPDASTDVFIPVGSVTNIASTAVCARLSTDPGAVLTLQNGSLRCSATSLGSTFLWSGGTIVGSPSFVIDAPGAQLFGAGDKNISASTFINNGVLGWDAGNIFVTNGAVIDNHGGWNAASDNVVQYAGGVPPIFENSGAFSKTAGAGSTGVNLAFHNTGQVRAFSGTIRFGSGLTSDAGAFLTQTGTAIEYLSATTLNTGTTLSGAGLHRVFNSVTVTDLVLADNVEFNSGSIAATPAGDFRINFTFNWQGGTLGGGRGLVDVIPPAVMTLNGGADKNLSDITLRNDGHIVWNAGSWFVTNAATLDNRASMTINSGNVLQYAGGVPPLFKNAPTGLIVKAAGAQSSIGLPFNQDGLIHAQGGNVAVNSSVTSTGRWIVDDGFLFTFNSSSTLNAGTTLRGAGLFRNTNSFNVTDLIPVDNFDLANGRVAGAGTLRVDGSMTWEAGTMGGGGGTVRITPGRSLVLREGSDKNLSDYTLTNDGDITWTAGSFFITNAATLNNNASITCMSDNVLQYAGGVPPQVNNSGLLRKSNSGGTTGLNIAFNNTGTVHAQTGTILVGGPFFSTGPLVADAGALMLYQGSVSLGSGAELRGGGLHRITSGNVNVTGTVPANTLSFEGGVIAPAANASLAIEGSFTWTASTLQGDASGKIDVLPGRPVLITGGSDKSISACTFRNQGSLTWDGGNIYMTNAAAIVNTGSFTCNSDNVLNYAGGAPPRMDNSGTFAKSAGAGITNVGLSFNNAGVVRAQTGTINFGGSFAQTAGRTTLAGGVIAAGPAMTYTGGSIDGAGQINAVVNNSGAAMEPGSAPGAPGQISISGVYTQSAAGSYNVDVVNSLPAGADRLDVGNIANLGGTLNVRAASGADLVPGTSWTIVTSTDRRGTFAANLPAGFRVQYTPASVVLQYSCPGDFNRDLTVDFFDYLDFVAAFDAEAPRADFNGDGTTDFFDYLDFVGAFDAGCE